MKDEQLQRSIEEGSATDASTDARAYQKVFDTLRKEPEFSLSPSFARKVVERMLQLRARKEQKRDTLWLSLGLVLITIALVVTIALTGFRPGTGVFSFLNSYGGLVAFGVAFVIFLNWLEKRLKLAQK